MHIFTFTSVGNVRVALVAIGAQADMRLSCTIISVVPAEAVAAAARRRGPIAVARRVVDRPVRPAPREGFPPTILLLLSRHASSTPNPLSRPWLANWGLPPRSSTGP